jgi:hypothetical protein
MAMVGRDLAVGCNGELAAGGEGVHRDRVREALALRHWCSMTSEVDVRRVRGFMVFAQRNQPPVGTASEEVSAFLFSLAMDGNVRASTQSHARAALFFSYGEVLRRSLESSGEWCT